MDQGRATREMNDEGRATRMGAIVSVWRHFCTWSKAMILFLSGLVSPLVREERRCLLYCLGISR